MKLRLVHNQVFCMHAITYIAGIDVFGLQGDEIAGDEACPTFHEARDKKWLQNTGCETCK